MSKDLIAAYDAASDKADATSAALKKAETAHKFAVEVLTSARNALREWALEGAPVVGASDRRGVCEPVIVVRATKTRYHTVSVGGDYTTEWKRDGWRAGYDSDTRRLAVESLPPEVRSAETWDAPNWRTYKKIVGEK
jgi:hypothetical protein